MEKGGGGKGGEERKGKGSEGKRKGKKRREKNYLKVEEKVLGLGRGLRRRKAAGRGRRRECGHP
jgi:hypothetical protein